MSARRWSLSFTAAVVVATAGCTASTPRPAVATPAPRTVYDLAYATASYQQKLDLYLPAPAARAAPLVVWIHGGGWHTGDKNAIVSGYDPSLAPPKSTSCADITELQVPDLATLLAKGYAVAAVNYRLTTDPVAAVKDAKAAVRLLRADAARYHLDPDRFAAWGDSAGGYSAIMLGVTGGQHTEFDGSPPGNDTVQAVVDWFGPTDASSMPGQLGAAESPYTYITAGHPLPPFMITHGDADCVVPPQQSQHLHDALTGAGADATLTLLPGAGHEDPAFMRTQLGPTLAFLDRTIGRA